MESSEGSENGPWSLLHLDSIRNRILVLALLATLIPAFSTAMLSFERTRRALAETLEAELQRAGSQTARELDLWEKERLYDLRVFSGSFEVTETLLLMADGGVPDQAALSRVSDYLMSIQSRFPNYGVLEVRDVEGGSVASSRPDGSGTELEADGMATLAQGESVVGEPYLDPSMGVVSVIAVPVQTADGRFLGGLVATLAFSTVTDVLEDFAPGETGGIELVTGEGRRIASSATGARLEQVVETGTLSRLAGAEGSTTEYVDTDGVDVVGLLTPTEHEGWSVLVQVPTAEAYGRVAQLRRTTVLLVLALLLVVGAAAYLIGLFIVRPLDRLTEGATAVAGGDLSVDLPVQGQHEVAMLTRVFNGMVSELRTSRARLDEASETLREQYAELQQISITDGLTGLYNRRHVMAEFEKEIGRAGRHERKLAVLMLDVDRFKQYNDSWGHQAGDEVLQGMGIVMKDATREPDVPGRYGGEEFIVLLPDCELEGAVAAAERIRRRLDREIFDGGKVTASIGVAEFPTHGETPMELIAAADIALYAAKEQGRDRVVAAGEKAETRGARPAPKKKGAAARRSAGEKAAPAKKKAAAKKSAAKKSAGKKSAGASAGKKSGQKKPAAKRKDSAKE